MKMLWRKIAEFGESSIRYKYSEMASDLGHLRNYLNDFRDQSSILGVF